MEPNDTPYEATHTSDGTLTFLQWWEHLRSTGVIARASQQLSATEIAEMATTTFAQASAQIEREAERAVMHSLFLHPYGVA